MNGWMQMKAWIHPVSVVQAGGGDVMVWPFVFHHVHPSMTTVFRSSIQQGIHRSQTASTIIKSVSKRAPLGYSGK